MHVLMTADPRAGEWTTVLTLCDALGQRGVRVTLVATDQIPDTEQVEAVHGLDNVTLASTAWPTQWRADAEDEISRSAEAFCDFADAAGADVVHMNGVWHAPLHLPAPLVVTVRASAAAWWKACRTIPLHEAWKPAVEKTTQALARADVVVAPSAAFLADLKAVHNPLAQTLVIEDGRSPSIYRPGVKRRIVLAAGALWDDAANAALLGAVAETVDTPVVAAGDLAAPDGHSFDGRGLATLGRLSKTELRRWMAEAAIFASPAYYDPAGIAVLEAALSGCALILSDIPVYRERWDGVATFVDPDDAAGLRRAIRMLTDMPQLATSDGSKARGRALAYSPAAMGDATLALYRSIALAAAA